MSRKVWLVFCYIVVFIISWFRCWVVIVICFVVRKIISNMKFFRKVYV